MYSNEYYDSVQRCTDFHKTNKTWSGKATFLYADLIKQLIQKHNARTLLNYGCGKGQHYNPESHIKIQDQTFDRWLGIDSVFLYDPCVENLDILPPAGSKFDAVIAIQCLTAVPDKDFDLVVNYLMSVTSKFCFVGNSKLTNAVKSKKLVADQNYFQETRNLDWWQEKFKNWQGSELVLHFLPN
jgi:hypothetical protein